MLLKLLFYYVCVCVFNKSNRVYLVFIKCNFNGERERERDDQSSQVVREFQKKKVKKERNFASFLTDRRQKKTLEAAFSSTTS